MIIRKSFGLDKAHEVCKKVHIEKMKNLVHIEKIKSLAVLKFFS